MISRRFRGISLSILMFLLVGSASSAADQPSWVDVFSGADSGYESAYSAVLADDGCPVVIGRSLDSEGRGAGTVRKLDRQSGDEVWQTWIKTSDTSDLWLNSIARDPQGELVVMGFTMINSFAPGIAIIAKLDPASGAVRWRFESQISPFEAETLGSLVLDEAGDVFAFGSRRTDSGYDYVVVKLSGSDGTEIWHRVWGGPGICNDYGQNIVLGESGGLVTAGLTEYESGLADCVTTRLDPVDGTRIWERRETGAAVARGTAQVVALPSGDFVTCSPAAYGPEGGERIIWRRYARDDGSTVWQRKWFADEEANEVLVSVASSPEGTPVLAGISADDLLVVKIDPQDGWPAWWTIPDLPGDVTARVVGVDIAADGTVLATRSSSSGSVTLKLGSATGETTAILEHPGLYIQESLGFADGSMLVVGHDGSDQTACFYESVQSSIPSAPVGSVVALEAWPNPFNPTVELSFELAAEAHVRLRIFDSRGRGIGTLLDHDRPAGNLHLRWDGRDAAGRAVPSGVYFALLEAGGARAVRKLVLAK